MLLKIIEGLRGSLNYQHIWTSRFCNLLKHACELRDQAARSDDIVNRALRKDTLAPSHRFYRFLGNVHFCRAGEIDDICESRIEGWMRLNPVGVTEELLLVYQIGRASCRERV